MPYRFVSFQPLRFSFAGQTKILLGLLLILWLAPVAARADSQISKLRKQAAKAMRNGDFANAETLLQEVVRLAPDDAESGLAYSYALYKQRKWLPAYDAAMRAEELVANDKQSDKKAAADFGDENRNAPILNDKRTAAARVRAIVGSIYLQAGRLAEARQILQNALIYNPNDALALASDAMFDFYENRSKIGLAKLRRAVFLEPDEPDFVFSQAQVAARTEAYREAADAYARFLRIAPETDFDRRDRITGLIAFLRYLGGVKSLYQPGGESQTRVACQIINNRPIVTLRVNNRHEPLRFVLDTGSGMTVISDETAARLGVKEITRGGQARAVGGGGKFPIVYGFLDSLRIGDAEIERVPIYIRKFNNTSDRFDGYLGLSVIAKFITTLDYAEKSLALKKNVFGKRDDEQSAQNQAAPPLPETAFQIPLRTTTSGFLSSEVSIGAVKEPFNFIVDTGASISVVAAETVNRGEFNEFMQPATLRVFGAAGIAENVSTLLLPRLTLGKLSREKVTAAILDLQPINETAGFEQAGILGGNFLLHYRLTFNFQNATITFEPTPGKKNTADKTAEIGENLIQ